MNQHQSLNQNQGQPLGQSLLSSSAATPPGPASRTGDDPADRNLAATLSQVQSYQLLYPLSIKSDKAKELAKQTTLECIQAWLAYFADRKAKGKPVDDVAGYLIKMIQQPGAWPPGHRENKAVQSEDSRSGLRFTSGKFGSEINH